MIFEGFKWFCSVFQGCFWMFGMFWWQFVICCMVLVARHLIAIGPFVFSTAPSRLPRSHCPSVANIKQISNDVCTLASICSWNVTV